MISTWVLLSTTVILLSYCIHEHFCRYNSTSCEHKCWTRQWWSFKWSKMHDKQSASAKKGINEKLSVQTKLPFKHLKQVYTCSHCLVCICGEVTYKKHMKNCSKFKCVICKKTFFSDRTFQKEQVYNVDHFHKFFKNINFNKYSVEIFNTKCSIQK